MYLFTRAPLGEAEPPTSAGTGAVMVFSLWLRKPAEKQCADSRLTPAKHVVSTMHGTRTVLLDSRSGRYYSLDEVGSRIWQLAQAGFPPCEIAQKLADEYDAAPEKLYQDVTTFLQQMKRSRLLVQS